MHLKGRNFRGINFREFFFGHFAGIKFREFGFTEDFAGINFRELSLTRDFTETYFRKSALFKDFSGVNLTFAFRNIFPKPYFMVLRTISAKINTFLLEQMTK